MNALVPVTLVARINEEAASAEAALLSGAEHARRCGELLIEAKGLVPHGQWADWLTENFARSPRTARACMQLARDPNWHRGANLPLRAALKEIADPRPSDPPPSRSQVLSAGYELLSLLHAGAAEDEISAAFERAVAAVQSWYDSARGALDKTDSVHVVAAVEGLQDMYTEAAEIEGLWRAISPCLTARELGARRTLKSRLSHSITVPARMAR